MAKVIEVKHIEIDMGFEEPVKLTVAEAKDLLAQLTELLGKPLQGPPGPPGPQGPPGAPRYAGWPSYSERYKVTLGSPPEIGRCDGG